MPDDPANEWLDLMDELDQLDPETGFDSIDGDEARDMFDPNQPRDRTGKWSRVGGGLGDLIRGHAGTESDPIPCEDVEEAVSLLASGKHVQLKSKREVCTLVDRLAQVVGEMKAKGEDAPDFDLCRVSVPKTNLFCIGNKGIPRIQMPQLKGIPTKGSRADRMKRDVRGEVDLANEFRTYLEAKGVSVTPGKEQASYLRASQSQLNGAKVGGIAGYLEGGGKIEGAIFVARDNYIVDGHHRWAAQVAVDLRDGKKDVDMDVDVIDLDILDVLREANHFAEEWGIPQAGLNQGYAPLKHNSGSGGTKSKERDMTDFSAKDVSPHARAKLKGILDHYRKMAHPFATCVRDQVKHGLSQGHAERRCAVIKDLALGTTKWRHGGDKKFEDEDAELDLWLAEHPDVHEQLLDGDFEEERAIAIAAFRDLG